MCGITGAIVFNSFTEESTIREMLNEINHRGPDGSGIFKKKIAGADVALAHARLSIIDLSNHAAQPMTYKNLTIVYNGEVYNFKEIKEELIGLGHEFENDSDTEVILHAYAEWKERALEKFIGMFAFCVLDETTKKLSFYRDRVGVKPLYYYWNNEVFLFGSELKSLVKHPKFVREINPKAVGHFMRVGYIPSPLSIYKNTSQINPGHSLTLDLETKKIEIKQYWSALDYFKAPPLKIDYEEAKIETEKLLVNSFDYRMVSDVPVGVFLSGGYDSTCVAALLQTNRTEKLKTFTIGFEEGNNEAPYAKETANYLGTDHSEYICTIKEAQELVVNLPHYYDEPFGDSSAIPTMLVCKEAKKKVTVALSADGGDEVFAGYSRYSRFHKNIKSLNNLSKKNIFGDAFLAAAFDLTSGFVKTETFKSHHFKTLSNFYKMDEKYRTAMLFEQSASLSEKVYVKMLKNVSYPDLLYKHDESDFQGAISIAQAIDYQNYMTNDILTKVDRAAMSVSLEGREPLLDHRILEFAARLPEEYKYDGITKKKILKDIVHKHVPKTMLDRPKSGFSLPIYTWLRGDLKYLIEEFLSESELEKSNLFNVSYVLKMKDLFMENKLFNQDIIWRLLQFQMWYKKWML